ncbi:hypothetical protein [Vulcanisaeta sp. JCM 14467]|uniref:hypothetical protein n=1 Tax=Vulcanisaeta sp. JCM 14467 TaxID=1295370 RepID=UPI0006CF3F21|nr:hypothetical protein [Vulcanisaeta sp. JCM 14467]
MNNAKCIEDLLNALMTFYSVVSIEHYMILLLIIKSRSTEGVYDQILNVVRDHLDKESRMLNNLLRLRNCLSEDTTTIINDFAKNVQDGIAMINDPEFISVYINDFMSAVRTLARYILSHEELLSKIINSLQEYVRKYMNDFTQY